MHNIPGKPIVGFAANRITGVENPFNLLLSIVRKKIFLLQIYAKKSGRDIFQSGNLCYGTQFSTYVDNLEEKSLLSQFFAYPGKVSFKHDRHIL